MRTIKELADEIGKSKPSVMQRIKDLDLRSALHKDGNKFLIPDDIAKKVIDSFSPKTQTDLQPVSDEIRNEYIDFLRSELDKKNEQLANMQQLLHQEQQLRLMADQKVLMLEEAQRQEQQRKWWQFWK